MIASRPCCTHRSLRLLAIGCLLACLSSLALGSSASASTRAFLSSFGTSVGEPAGHVATGTGVAVNHDGAGGVSPGEVYVADSQNARVDVFSPSGGFVRAFGWDVVATGQDDAGANEEQLVTVPPTVTAGTFKLSLTTATATGIMNGTASITGVEGAVGGFNVGDTITQATGYLAGGAPTNGIPSGTTVTGVGSGTLTLSAAATGVEAAPRPLTGTETTAPIPFNATAAELKAALEALPGVGSGNVTVSGGPGASATPFTVTFSGGNLALDDVAEMTIANSLTGGSATVVTTLNGGGYEVCRLASSPGDSCKAGSRLTGAGAVNGPEAIAIDQATGNVFVASQVTRRVDVYSAAGGFEAAFGLDVVPGGAAGTGDVTQGSLVISSVTTTAKAFTVGAPITGSGIPPGTTITSLLSGKIAMSQAATASVTGTAITTPTGAGNVSVNEQQTVTLPASTTGGTFSLTYGTPTPSATSATATGIPASASAAELQAKLAALSNIGAGNVEVTGPTGGPWVVEFKGGRFADTNVSAMTGAGTTLIPTGVVTIVTTREGTGFETCTTASGCQTSSQPLSAAAAGSLPISVQPGFAIDPTSGHLYVADRTTRRINEFSPQLNGSQEVSGASFVRAFGWKVIAGSTANEEQTCTMATGCQAGLTGTADGQIPNTSSPVGLALDSSGAIYMVPTASSPSVSCTSAAPCRVQKLKSDGSFDKNFGPSGGGSGSCQLTWTTGASKEEAAAGIAIDPETQNVIVTRRTAENAYSVCEFRSETAAEEPGALLQQFPPGSRVTSLAGYLQPAISTDERIYVNNELSGQRGATELFGPVPPPSNTEMVSATATGVHTAELVGRVTPPAEIEGQSFATSWRFEYSTDQDTWVKTPVPDGSAGSTPVPVTEEAQITGLKSHTQYFARICGSTSTTVCSQPKKFTTFSTAPVVIATNPEEVTQTAATLAANLEPGNLPTTYHFEWGEEAGSYPFRVPVFDRSVGRDPVIAKDDIAGLQPGTLYHFRVVATNFCHPTDPTDPISASVPCTTFGPDQRLETLDSCGLIDHRCFELVSPADKGPRGSAGKTIDVPSDLFGRTSVDGGAVAYTVDGGLPDSTAGEQALYLARRDPAGWNSQLIGPTAAPNPELAGNGSAIGRTQAISETLSCSVVMSPSPLAAGAPSSTVERGGSNLFRRDNATGSYSVITSLPAVNAGENAGVLTSGEYQVLGTSPDCERGVFRSFNHYPGIEGVGTSRLYEWDGGVLRGVDRIEGASGDPEPAEATPGALPGGTANRWQVVSADGSRLVFSAKSKRGQDVGHYAVFAHSANGAGNAAIDVSQSQTLTPNTGDSRYQAASKDGKEILFTARYGLALNGTSSGLSSCITSTGAGCDLYRYSIDDEELTDLSADTTGTDTKGAGVAGVVDTSADGSNIYFAARGQLVEGQGLTGPENESSHTFSLYLWDGSTETIRFVGRLKEGEANGGPTTESSAAGNALVSTGNQWSAEATPDGKALVWETAANVTGYQSSPAAMAYLYSDDTHQTICVSCPRDGSPSVNGPKSALSVVDPVLLNVSTTGAPFRLGGLSADGSTVFFRSQDRLAAGAISGVKHIYEWKEGQIALVANEPIGLVGESGLRVVGASGDASDFAFATPERLVAEDSDERSDVYDARVGGGFPPPSPPASGCEPLQESSCQPPASASDGNGAAPQSSVASGEGNLQPPGRDKARPKHCRKHGKVVRCTRHKHRHKGGHKGRASK